jgi:hypothetical protein
MTTQLIRRLSRLIAIAIVILLGSRPAHAELIDWKAFEARLSDCDVVHATIERNKVTPTQIEVVIESSLVSWKAVGVHASNGSYYEVNTGRGQRDSMQLAAYTVTSAKFLQLGKQKYGVQRIGVYEVEDLRHLQGGDRVTFKWVQDYCPDLRGYINPGALPSWMPPGKTQKVYLTAAPNYDIWNPDQLLAIHFDAAFSVAARVIDRLVTYKDKLHWSTEITAPTMPGTYYLSIWINQRGGDSGHLITKKIVVSNTQPKPPVIIEEDPPPPPVYVKVPNLVGQSLENGLKALANLGLDSFVYDRDASVPDSKQIITGQSPMGGSSVREGTRVAVTVMPPGYSVLPIINCDRNRTTHQLYEYSNDQWHYRGAIPSLFGDGDACPAIGAKWFEHALTDGQWGFFAVVDPMRCSDPANPACRSWEALLLGNSKGPQFPYAYVE